MARRPIQDQVVVIVGASSGIGRGAALAFARRGARVVVSARDADALTSLARQLQQQDGRALAVPADVTDPEAMHRVAREAASHYGRIDTWVQAAAVALYARLEDTTPEEFRRVVETNLLGSFHALRAALPHLKRAGGGSFVQISSVEGRRSLPYHSAYAASKHGINGMLEAARLELRREGADVRITNVQPSAMDTPLFEQARTKLGVKPKGFPPVYHPDTAVRAIVRAAERPMRDVTVGGGGRALILAQALSPRLVDTWMVRAGFRRQRTDEPRSAEHPDNLDEPVPGHDEVEGGHEGPRREHSLYTTVRTNPWPGMVGALVLGSLLGTAGGLLWTRRRRTPRLRRRGESEAEAARRSVIWSSVEGTA